MSSRNHIPRPVTSRTAPTPGAGELFAHPARRANGAVVRLAGSVIQSKTRSGDAAIVRSRCNVTIPRPYNVGYAMQNQVVVAGALIVGDTLLVAQRARPAELAGRWELPGGKVGPGETDAAALARELAEELGIEVSVGRRVGRDVALSD